MLPSPQTSEDVLAPTPFQPGGAEIPNGRATVIWRKSQRHRADRRIDARRRDRARRAMLGCRLFSIRIVRPTIVPTPYDGTLREKSRTFISRLL